MKLNHEYFVSKAGRIVFRADNLEDCLEYVNKQRGDKRVSYDYTWQSTKQMNSYVTQLVAEHWWERSAYRPLYDIYAITHLVQNEYYICKGDEE